MTTATCPHCGKNLPTMDAFGHPVVVRHYAYLTFTTQALSAAKPSNAAPGTFRRVSCTGTRYSLRDGSFH